jgi:hypothetical protein
MMLVETQTPGQSLVYDDFSLGTLNLVVRLATPRSPA